MDDTRFNALLNGPLHHPMFPLHLTRVVMALKHVVDATGEQGERALVDWCKDREEWDRMRAKQASDA